MHWRISTKSGEIRIKQKSNLIEISGEENIQTTIKNGLKEISLKSDSHRLSIIII